MIPVIISSCKEYEVYHIPRLIKNIHDVNIPADNVIIISGGHDTNSTCIENGVKIIRTTYRCFEFTPFLYTIKNIDSFKFDYAFFTHDTVIFGKTFYEKLNSFYSILKEGNIETMGILPNSLSMNIGIYSYESILRNKEILEQLEMNTNDKDKLTEMKIKLIEYEDFIFNTSSLYKFNCTWNENRIILKDVNDVDKEVYIKNIPELDFIKMQTNHCGIKNVDLVKFSE